MINAKVEAAINDQIRKEMFSANLYLAMSSYATNQGLAGIAHWLMVQYHEEMFHAMKFYTYLTNQGAQPKISALEAPKADYGTPLEIFQEVLKHEQTVTGSINELAELASREHDRASSILLQWFVMEQVEEENNANEIIASLKMIKTDASALFAFDQKLGTRTLTVPTDYSAAASSAQLKAVA